MFADWTDRISKRRGAARAAAPAGRRAQPRAHAVGLGQTATRTSTTRSPTDKRNPTVERQRQGLWRRLRQRLAALGRSRRAHDRATSRSRSDARTRRRTSRRRCWRRRRTGAARSIWKNPANPHNPMMDQRHASGLTAPCVRRRTRRCASGGDDKRSRKNYPMAHEQPAGRGLRSADAADDAGRHVLRHPPSAVRRGQGQHALLLAVTANVDRLGQHAHLGRDRTTPPRRRAGARSSSTPTATARSSRRRHAADRGRRVRQLDGIASTDGGLVLRHHRQPADGSIWGAAPACPGRIVRMEIGANPPRPA